uniref:Transcriptional corepressor LEUNIG n=1 Tax=Kalanchoe fedtschenkoi TaxID=63787 RepID=A0A7N0TBV3_KALFE
MAHPATWEADKMLDVYIYDYLLKRKLQVSAKAFVEEARVSTDPVAIDAPGGFLLEWWSVFWDIFIARTNEKRSEVAASYVETQMIKARELQQQQQHPHQKTQAQQQGNQLQMQLLLQRHAQQQQQRHQRDGTSHTGMNPVSFLDSLRRQPSGAASVLTSKINENGFGDPLRRGSMDNKSRLDETRGQSPDPKHVSSLKLDATGVQAQSGGNLQRVQNRNPPLPLLGQAMKSKMSSVPDTRNIVDGQEGSLLGAHGSNQGGNSLTLNGWPLTGLDQLRSGLQQQKSGPAYQLYLQQQLLLQAQQNMIVPAAAGLENRKMTTFLNGKNAGVGRDGHLSFIGNAISNAGSPMQASDADLLNKTMQSSQLQQLYMQHQLSAQQPRNTDPNSNPIETIVGSSLSDACLASNSQRINQQGRKRKISMSSSGPANSSGTLNSCGPSASSVPSTPPAHTAVDAISVASLSRNGDGSKASATIALEDTETLPSVQNQLADVDRSVIDGPLEDNVESLLCPDVGDSTNSRANVSEGFTFAEHQAIPVSTKLECCAFSSDGKLLATGGHDKKVVLWCTESFTMRSTLEEHTLMITDVRFSPTTPRLATSSADQTVRVWDADNPSYSLRTFTGHSAAVTSLDFHPCKDDLVYSADANGEIRCWSITNGSCKKVFQGDVAHVRFQPRHGRFFAGISEDSVSIIDAETQAIRLKLQGHKKPVRCLCWDFSGEYLATVSEDMARVWSFAPRGNGECIHELSSTRSDFRSCTFHPTYSFLLVIGGNQMLELWNMVENKMMTIPAHEEDICALAASSMSGVVASASSDGLVKLWK